MESNTSGVLQSCGWQEEDDPVFEFYVYVFVFPVLMFIGLLANVVTIKVLGRPSLLSINSLFLILIAVFDCIALTVHTLMVVSWRIGIVRFHHVYMHVAWVVGLAVSVSYCTGVVLLLLALIERLFAVCCSKTAGCRRVCIRWLCPTLVLCPAFCWVLLSHLPSFVSMIVVERTDCPEDSFGRYYITLAEDSAPLFGFMPAWNVYRDALFALPPILLGVAVGVVLLVVHDLERQRSVRFHDTTRRSAALGLFYSALALPQLALLLLELSDGFYSEGMFEVYAVLVVVMRTLKMVYCSGKFVVYCLAGPFFRQEVVAMFSGQRQLLSAMVPQAQSSH